MNRGAKQSHGVTRMEMQKSQISFKLKHREWITRIFIRFAVTFSDISLTTVQHLSHWIAPNFTVKEIARLNYSFQINEGHAKRKFPHKTEVAIAEPAGRHIISVEPFPIHWADRQKLWWYGHRTTLIIRWVQSVCGIGNLCLWHYHVGDSSLLPLA